MTNTDKLKKKERDEGISIGRDEGLKEGISIGIIRTAKRMLEKGIDVPTISDIIGLNEGELIKLSRN